MSGPLENHLAQFLLGVSKKAVSQHKDSFFIPNIPSISFGMDEITNEQKLIEKLKINQIPSANPISWPLQSIGDIENKIQEFFDVYELNNDQTIQNDEQKQKEVTQEILCFDRQIQELSQKIMELSQKSQELDQFNENENIFKSMNEQLEELKAKKKDYVDSNLSFAVQHFKSIFEIYQQMDQMNRYSISILDQNQTQISQNEKLAFSQFSYSSEDQQAILLQEKSYEMKLAQSLKGFGLGQKQLLNQLEKSIEEVFENLIVQCEYSQIYFERNWMPFDLFLNQNIGLANKEISKWSNGTKHDQDQNSEFPYIVVGAVFCKNLQIKGLKSDENTKKLLQEMQNQQNESFCLIFNCQEDVQINNSIVISEDSINIKSLRVLGLILCPISQFPKIICQKRKFPHELATIQISDYIKTYKKEEIINIFKNDQEINQFPDWQQQISQIIENQEYQDQILTEDFPWFQNYAQKQFFIKKYEENKIDVDLKKDEKLISKVYKDLNKQMISKFKDLADKYKIISNHLKGVFQEEIIELETIFQDKELRQEKIDFTELSKKFFIHQNILQKIYKQMKSKIQIDFKIENLREEIKDMIELSNEEILEYYSEDTDINSIHNWKNQIELIIHQLRSTLEEQVDNKQININPVYQIDEQILQNFAKFSNMNEQDLKTKFQEKSQELESIIIEIFEENPEEYMRIKIICQEQNELKFLLENDIEQFFNNIKKPRQLKTLLDDITEKKPILCLKLLSELLRQNSQINQQQQEEQDILRMGEKFTEIIETSFPHDIIDVFVKALLLQQQMEDYYKKEGQQIYEQFEKNLRKNYTDEEITNLKQKIDSIENNLQSSEDKQAQIQDLIKNELNKIEEINLQSLQKYFTIEEKVKFFKEKYETNQAKDLETLSQIAQIPIALHYQSNLCEYKIFGEQMLDQNNLRKIVHLVIDNQNHSFSILNILPSNDSHISINLEEFKLNYKQVYEILQPWLRTFLGYKSLFAFIYNIKEKCHCQKNIDILDRLAQRYNLFVENQNENFQSLKNVCTQIQNQSIFREWFEQIQQTEIGSIFATKFEIFWARSNVKRQILIKNKIKQKFQSFEQILDLKDFNRLRGRKELDILKQDLFNAKKDGKQFINEVIQQMFGYVIRRENIQQLIDHIKELQIFQQISVRFLVSLVLQYSNIELRQRLIYYLSEYYSVPLIIICQNQYINGQQNLVYLPEIAFEMLEGIGIFNFGAGRRCLQFSGKSQLMNDLLFPAGEFQHQAFEQNDENVFSNGQIDVFFEKSFSFKRQIVIIDGQGNISYKAIQSVSKLTNIAIINFSFEEIQELDSLQDLQKKVEIIKQFDIESFIILVLRDARSSEQFDQPLSSIVKNKQKDQLIQQLDKINKNINFCICLENMTLDKSQRLKKISPILQIINNKVQDLKKSPEKFKFTKKNFLENFIIDDDQNKDRVEKVQKVIIQSEEFIDQVKQIQDDIYQDDALPVLQLKSQIRQQVLEIRNNVTLEGEKQELLETNMMQKLEELKEQIKNIMPSQILLSFKNIVLNQDGNRSLILYEIQKELRKITAQQLKVPNDKKTLLNKNQKEEATLNKQFSKEEKLARQEQYDKELEEINNEIHKKQISLEHLWRCLVFYMEQQTKSSEFNDKIQKNMISESIHDILKNGDCFELIDGENLEFKGEFIQEVINQNKKDKVLVICVIGPQSSGKSTLMNFSFGTQFFTSAGRCTKGIYFTLQKFPSDIPNSQDVKWLLMLDTEGLQSPERQDKEYDRKIVLFAMLSANVVIINSRGEINNTMTDTLKMCCLTFDMLKYLGNTPQIIYTNGQNNTSDLQLISQQVQDLKPKVIEASNSPTIEKTAEEILGYNDDKIIIFGYAYNSQVFQQEKMRGLDQNISFQVGNTNFGVETSNIFKKICELIKQDKIQFFEFSKWLEDSRHNWNTIDKFSGDINAFANLDEFKNDQKVNKKIHELWEQYLNGIKLDCEIQKISEQKNRLHQIFKQQGKQQLDKEIDLVDKINQKEMDDHLQQHIYDKFESWMKSQKGITAESIKKYYKIIEAKMDVQKREFMIQLQEKLKDQQMDYINETGIKFYQDKAIQIRPILKNMPEEEKENYLQNQFDQCQDELIKDIRKENKFDQTKKTYFNDLLQSFKLQNEFIQLVGEKQYKDLNKRIENKILPNDQGEIGLKLQDILMQELTNKSIDQGEMFRLDNNTFHYISNDPKKRMFKEDSPEKYLKLEELIQFNYHYQVISDMNNQLDRELLKKQIFQYLEKKIQAQIQVPQQILIGQIMSVTHTLIQDDWNAQSYFLSILFNKLSDYGYDLLQNDYLQQNQWDYTKNLRGQDIFKICRLLSNKSDKKNFAKQFVDNLKFNKNKKKEQIDLDMIKYFKEQEVIIYARENPNENLQVHIEYLKQQKDFGFQQIENDQLKNDHGTENKLYLLQNQIHIRLEQLEPQKTKNFKLFDEITFQTLINPVKQECSIIQKQKNLINIASRQLDFILIAQEIINSVKKVLNYEDMSESMNNIQQDIYNNNRSDKEHMTPQQVQDLENYYMRELSDQIDMEIKIKLGLNLTNQMRAKISWCALIVSWIMIYKKTQKKNHQYLERILKQKEQQFQDFKNIANGNVGKTQYTVQDIIKESIKNFDCKEKLSFQIKILQEIKLIQSSFDTFNFYKQMDDHFLKNTQMNLDDQIRYAENQVLYFKNYAQDLTTQLIEKQIIENYGEQVKKNIIENVKGALNLFEIINQQKQKEPLNWYSAANYFQIKFHKSDYILNFQEKQQLVDQLSPVIYQVLINILKGNTDMNNILFDNTDQNMQKNQFITLKDQNGVQNNYEFMILEDGPLKIFTELEFNEKLKNRQNCQLIMEILNVLKNYKEQKEIQELSEIDIIISSANNQLKQELINLQSKVFDSHYFECNGKVDALQNLAIGCKVQCIFCKRKCELQYHSTEIKHTCETVGHQQRVFSGGCIKNQDEIIFPSLRTCDNIKPKNNIEIVGQDIDKIQILHSSQWEIEQQGGENGKDNFSSQQQMFNKFWEKVGQKYCNEQNLVYLKNYDDYDRILEGKLFQSSIQVIILDESRSMWWKYRWTNAVSGAKKYIQFIRDNHINPEKVQLIIIFFSGKTRVAYLGSLMNQINENIWVRNGSGTEFGKPLEQAIKIIDQYIEKKQIAKIIFFTDGQAKFPKEAIEEFKTIITENKKNYLISQYKQKLNIVLLCESDKNPALVDIRDKLNEFSINQLDGKEMCKLVTEIKTEDLGNVMIETFSDLKYIE